ncbi:hypothetical protein C8R46DRAFT_1024168 [Mycena filopes]|nr:hypothetical protein C8R46DRAFT_1024168 [Mycena filopes]
MSYKRSIIDTILQAAPSGYYWMIEADPGKHYSARKGRTYITYNYTYEEVPPAEDNDLRWLHPSHDRMDLMQIHFVHRVKFAADRKQAKANIPLPKVSHVDRHQMFIWVQDTSLRSKLRGIVVVITSTVPDIKEPATIESPSPPNHIVIDVPPANITQKDTGSSTLSYVGLHAKKLLQALPFGNTKAEYPPPTESGNVAWDVTHQRWISPAFPSLEQSFVPLVDSVYSTLLVRKVLQP